jgi:hypothetical protein
MIRFNYLPAKRRRPTSARGLTIAIDNRIRGPLAALLATLGLCAVLGLLEFTRLESAQRAYAVAAMQLRGDTLALAQVGRLRERLVDDTRLRARAAELTRANIAHADELVWICNHLPAHTWLRSVRYEAGTYVLDGTAGRASDVAGAMLRLHDAGHPAIPQLVSLADDGSTSLTSVRYRLRLETAP